MNRLWIARLLLLLCPFLIPSSAWADKWKNYHDAGEQARYRKQYAEAEKQYKAALAEAEKSGDALKTGTTLHGLALSYAEQQQYAKAEPLFKRSLEMVEKNKPDSAELGYVLNNFAWMYAQQRKYAEAEPLHKRALQIRERAGSHTDLALTLEDLGFLYQAVGSFKEAEGVWDRSLEEWAKAVGTKQSGAALSLGNLAERAEIAHSLFNVGVFYFFVGKYRQAEPLLKRCLEIQEKTAGRESAEVERTLSFLGRISQAFGRYSEAEQLLQRELAVAEKVYGAHSGGTSPALCFLARVYVDQRRFADAEPLLNRALALTGSPADTDPVALARVRYELGNLYLEQGKYAEAEPLVQESLAELQNEEPKQPYNIVNKAIRTAALARLHSEQGRLTEAEPLFQEALANFDANLLGEHPAVQACLKHYVTLLRKLGREADAAALETRARAIRQRLGLADSDSSR